MSFNSTYRKFQSMSALALRQEGNAIVRQIARRESAKILAFNAEITPRHVYNLREEIGQPDLAWPHFIKIAQQYPELRQRVLAWLDADNGQGGNPQRLIAELQQFLQDRTK